MKQFTYISFIDTPGALRAWTNQFLVGVRFHIMKLCTKYAGMVLHYTHIYYLLTAVNDWNVYRFGGIYMDMDMIVLRPLDSLNNTVGSEITPSGDLRLNGAILIFDKSRLGCRLLFCSVVIRFFF